MSFPANEVQTVAAVPTDVWAVWWREILIATGGAIAAVIYFLWKQIQPIIEAYSKQKVYDIENERERELNSRMLRAVIDAVEAYTKEIQAPELKSLIQKSAFHYKVGDELHELVRKAGFANKEQGEFFNSN